MDYQTRYPTTTLQSRSNKNLAPPTTRKHLRRFIGLINYYRDMWAKRSELLAPLSRLTSDKNKWQWTSVEQTAFDKVKAILSKETLLAFPDFTQPFIIHTDASKVQLGSVISQNNIPIAYYSRKLNPAQTRYTTTERELLSIVETLKEFRNILLGQQITIYTDHKNLTYKNFYTERVLRWRLILEEFGPELIYLPGQNNAAADALSRLDTVPNSPTPPSAMAEAYGFKDDDLPEDAFPLTYKLIMQHQLQDKNLMALAEYKDGYDLTTFHGGERREL